MIPFECPYCSAQIQIPAGRVGRAITCPRCKGQVPATKPPQPVRHDEYDFKDESAAHVPAPTRSLTTSEIEALEAEEEPQKKKRRRPTMEWSLFLGGFGFPWTPGAVLQWLLIAIWAAAAGWLTHAALAMGIGQPFGEANMYQAILAILAALGAVIAGVGGAGIAAIHGLTILLETASGNDRMENWPNVSFFLEWIGNLFHIFNSAALSVVLGLGLDWLLPNLLGAREITVAITVFFLFPIFLLCTLETDSAFLPVSSVVLASLGRQCLAWLAFFAQSGSLLTAAAALVYYLGPQLDMRLAIPLAALLFSAVVMIYFRLLGRLAFYCTVEVKEEEEEEVKD